MVSLLVVDDEEIITDGLYELFTYNTDGEMIVHKAYSATQALAIARAIRIDILVSDIAMPRMDGLELHREVCVLWPQCKTIFLTGYDHFEYAQAAIRGDAVDYILKSESDEAVLDAVRKTVIRIERENAERYAAEKAEHDRKMMLPLLQSRYFTELLDGAQCTEEERHVKFAEMEAPLDPAMPAILLLGCIDDWPAGYNCATKNKALCGIKGIVEEILTAKAELVAVEYPPFRLVWLLQPRLNGLMEMDGDAWNGLAVYLQGMMGPMQTACREVLGLSVSFALQNRPAGWPDLHGRFTGLLGRVKQSFLFGAGFLFLDDLDPSGGDDTQEDGAAREAGARRELAKTELLADLLQRGRRTEYIELYLSVMNAIDRCRPFSYDLCVEIYYTVSLMLISCLNRSGLRELAAQRIGLDELFHMDEQMGWDRVTAYFLDVATVYFGLCDAEKQHNTSRVVALIREYTEKHIGEELSLVSFADMLHFHPFYLSRLFKQATGIGLSEFVLEAKMRRARQLLQQQNLRINEISLSLGFTSSSYFAKVFKKHTSLNPQQYRDSLG